MVQETDPIAAIRSGFFLECDELLERLTDALGAPGLGSPGDEGIHVAFRAVHSIKGGAAAVGLSELVIFAHEMEIQLDLLRSGHGQLTPGLTADLLRATDRLATLVDDARPGVELPEAAGELRPGPAPQDRRGAAQDAAPTPPPIGAGEPPWVIHFRPGADLYASGNETLHLLNALAGLGDAEVVCDTTDLPALADLNPEEGVLTWSIRLTTLLAETAIRAVFDFVEDLCDLTIARDAGERHSPDLPPSVTGTFTDGPVPDGPVPAPTRPTTEAATVRVDLERIDRLMNLVGELVINQSILAQTLDRARAQTPDRAPLAGAPNAATDRYSPTMLALETLEVLTRDVQDAVMAIRAQSVKPLFQRMNRILREASATLGKPAELICLGTATEVDRSVIERLAEPLTHMIRNAIDHGLEPMNDRQKSGKPDTGRITLSAAHRAGRVIIELSDDGGGIQRDRVREAAVAKGLILADASLTDAETDALLFHPGFSTAHEVSAMSGRGVGLDVVHAAIRALGGRISIRSEPGQGTRFTISLPLTLAVLEGMVVRAGGQTLVVPLAAVLETAALADASFREVAGGQRLIRLRDQYTSICDLAATLGFGAASCDQTRRIAILVSDEDDRRVALIVDQVIDQRQVVIKGLRDACGTIPGIAAATILGDGRVALIVDPDGLLRLASNRDGQPDAALNARRARTTA